jgi:26S proteasome regulatory subunit N7
MGFAYESLCSTLGLPLDAGVLARLRAENAAEVSRLDSVIADAKENHGVVELGAAVMKKAQYLGSVGDKEGALKAYTEVPDKALSTGGKADIAMACARLAFISGDKK